MKKLEDQDSGLLQKKGLRLRKKFKVNLNISGIHVLYKNKRFILAKPKFNIVNHIPPPKKVRWYINKLDF